MDNLDNKILDAIKEIMNIGIGEASANLSQIFNKRIKIDIPVIKIVDKGKLLEELDEELKDAGIFISQNFSGSLSGQSVLTYSRKSTQNFLKLLLNVRHPVQSLSSNEVSALQEIGNIILSSTITTIANSVEKRISLKLPQIFYGQTDAIFNNMHNMFFNSHQTILMENTLSTDDESISGTLLILLSFSDFKIILDGLISKFDK